MTNNVFFILFFGYNFSLPLIKKRTILS